MSLALDVIIVHPHVQFLICVVAIWILWNYEPLFGQAKGEEGGGGGGGGETCLQYFMLNCSLLTSTFFE